MAGRRLIPEIAPGERLRFWCASLGFMCVASSALIARSAGDALFLSRYDASFLPYMYIGSAIVVALVSYAYGAFTGRASIGQVTWVASALLAVACIGMRVALTSQSGGVRIASYFLADVLVNLPMLLFWGFLAFVFDLREGKRLFGLVGSAGTAACILAGLAVRPLATRLGTENLFVVVAALSALFAGVVMYLTRHEAARLAGAGKTPPGVQTGKVGYYSSLLKTRQLRNLTLLIIVMWMALVAIDFQFKTVVGARYSGAELAGFFGRFYSIANLAALFIQLFLVHRIMRYAGLLVALLILPFAVVTTAVGTALTGRFGWTMMSKAVDPIFNYSINNAGLQMLYLGIKKQSRGQARAFVEGVMKPMAMALAGVALVAIPRGDGLVRMLGQAIAVLGGVWLLVSWRSFRAYMVGLIESVGARTVDLSQAGTEVSDRALRTHMRQALLTATDEEVPYIGGLLVEVGNVDATEEFRQLLGRPSPVVKVAALEYLRERGDAADVASLVEHTRHQDPEVREAAIHAAAAVAGEDVVLPLEERLTDDRVEVRASAAAELINVGDLDAFLAAGAALKAMLASADLEARVAATEALAVVRTGGLTRLLEGLLRDADGEVRRAALGAFRTRPSNQLIPRLVTLLADDGLRAEVTEVLVELGPSAVGPLRACFDRSLEAGDPALVRNIPEVIARIGDPAGLEVIHRALDEGPEVRGGAVEALQRLVLAQPSVQPYRDMIQAQIEIDLERGRRALEQRDSLGDEPCLAILRGALDDQYRQHVRNLLTLVGCVTTGVDMHALYASVMDGKGEARVQGLEILDNVLEPSLKAGVLSLVDPRPRATPPAAATMASYLTETRSEWVVAGAIFALAERDDRDHLAQLLELVEHPRAVVRETALDALSRLGPADMVTTAAARLQGDPDPAVRELAGHLVESEAS